MLCHQMFVCEFAWSCISAPSSLCSFPIRYRYKKKDPAEAGARSSGDVSSIGVAEAELMPLLRISFLLMKAVIVRLKLGHLVALIRV